MRTGIEIDLTSQHPNHTLLSLLSPLNNDNPHTSHHPHFTDINPSELITIADHQLSTPPFLSHPDPSITLTTTTTTTITQH